MRTKLLLVLFLILPFVPTTSFSQSISDYLILQDIGTYKLDSPEKVFAGEPPIGGPRLHDNWPGVISAAGHFPDHVDKTYEVMYIGGDGLASPTVQVTQHAGSESDSWLLHEVERGFRDTDNLEASPSEGSRIRVIGSNRIFFYGGGVVSYMWISNSIVINIEYTNLSGPKPEPLAIVQAYLQKHPSTIPASLVLDNAHSEQWIKDEMERRLWLGDRWFLHQEQGKVELSKALNEIVDHLEVFLDYREKYFGISAESEKNLLAEYLSKQNATAIKNKLTEYKQWWSTNKNNPITLP